MDIASSQPFLNDQALINRYGAQMAGFQPGTVAQPNAANMRMRDVIMSQGMSSPWIGAAANAGVAAGDPRTAGLSPGASATGDRIRAALAEHANRGAITSMFPVVSSLALGGAQQETGRYAGTADLVRQAGGTRLAGLEGAAQLATQNANLGTSLNRVDIARQGANVATPIEALLAEAARQAGLNQIGQTTYNNTWGYGSLAPGGSVQQFNAQQGLQAGQAQLQGTQQQLINMGYTGAMPGATTTLRSYYG